MKGTRKAVTTVQMRLRHGGRAAMEMESDEKEVAVAEAVKIRNPHAGRVAE